VKYKKYSIMKKLNLEAYGLAEMDSESRIGVNGGFGANPFTWGNVRRVLWNEVKEAASDFGEGFTEGFKAGVK
jgi:hypothetical protein